MDYFIVAVIVVIIALRLPLFINLRRKKKDKVAAKYVEDILNIPNKEPEIILNLPYISVSNDDIIFFHELKEYDIDSDLKEDLEKLIELSNSKMLILDSNTSNLDLKKKYGQNNFNILLNYDTNHKNFISLLCSTADKLIKYHKEPDCIKLLELGVKYHSDISKNYILLANLYKKENRFSDIKKLVDIVHSSTNLSRKKILNEISELK